MKYIVITSKHHDGFAMFDSAVSHYDIVERTPFEKDPMAALAVEAKKAGPEVLLLLLDHGLAPPAQYVDAPGKDPNRRQPQDRDHSRPEGGLHRLHEGPAARSWSSKYDPAVLWFDGEWMDWWNEEDGQDLYTYVRGLKPNIIINNRVGTGREGMEGLSRTDREYAGDFGTPEQQIPANGMPGVDWESCMTMNDTWGFKSYDTNWKSAETHRPQPDRHRVEGRQLPAERRADGRR